MDVVRQIVRKDGILGTLSVYPRCVCKWTRVVGLYAGMEATFWRHLWWNAGYFGCIFKVREMLPKPQVRVLCFRLKYIC